MPPIGLLRPGARTGKKATFEACIVLAALAGASIASAQSFIPIRVNSYGSAYTDSAGNVWSADTGYNTGSYGATGAAITGTSDPALYQDNRWDAAGGSELEYTFAVPNGVYRVRLLFAEVWSGAYYVGARRFNVQLEGTTVFQDVDVFGEAGANAALIKTATVGVTDGAINIRFVHGVENPFVSALEITSATEPTAPTPFFAVPHSTSQINLSWTASADDVEVAGYEVERCEGAACSNFSIIAAPTTTSYRDSGLATATIYRYRVRAFDGDGNRGDYSAIKTASTQSGIPMEPIRINVGGSGYTDTASNTWSADTGANMGYTATAAAAIANTNDPYIYRTIRWDDASAPELEYAVAVASGSYYVNLHFAETWSGAFAVGARVFHVQLEGATVFPNLDVFAEVGANAAQIKTASAFVSDGQLNIRFVHVTENPFLNGIEVMTQLPTDGEPPTVAGGFSAVPVSTSQMALSWTASTDNVGVDSYALERCAGPSCTNFTQIATPIITGFTDTGLTAGMLYRYRVRARDAAGNFSAYSAIAEAAPQQGSGTGSNHYSYDALGRLITATAADGSSVSYDYDDAGNVTSIVRTTP